MNDNISEKEKFFAKVSHDLRGSFTSILGFSDILNDPSENLTDVEKMEFAKRIGNQSHESFELLKNFVNWLKLENYTYGLTVEKLDLLDVCNELSEIHKKRLNEKEINLKVEIEDSTYVSMDYEIIHSILNNIFNFLIKTFHKNSTLLVKLIQQNESNTYLEITASNEKSSSFLQNIDLRDLNNDLSFPMVFAIKFTELSGGKFDFSVDKDSDLIIDLTLPNIGELKG